MESAEPDPQILERAEADVARMRAEVREAEDLLRRLREGREAWSRQGSHRAALKRLRIAIDAPPHTAREQLRAAIQQAEVERVRAAVMAESGPSHRPL